SPIRRVRRVGAAKWNLIRSPSLGSAYPDGVLMSNPETTTAPIVGPPPARDDVPHVSDKQLRARILEQLSEAGTPLLTLCQALGEDADRVRQAVARLSELDLVELDHDIVRATPFIQKAKKIFRFR